jgi:hypothetical protein
MRCPTCGHEEPLRYAKGIIGPAPALTVGFNYASLYEENPYNEYVQKWASRMVRNWQAIEEMYLVAVFARMKWPLYLAWKLGYRGMRTS